MRRRSRKWYHDRDTQELLCILILSLAVLSPCLVVAAIG